MRDLEIAKQRYMKYKFANVRPIMSDNWSEVEILFLLDRLGFPMYDNGTYMYMGLVLRIVNELLKIDVLHGNSCLELITQLSDGNSPLYVNYSRDELNMSVDRFHDCVNRAISLINPEETDQNLLFNVNENGTFELSYGNLALTLALRIIGVKKSKKNNLIKIRNL